MSGYPGGGDSGGAEPFRGGGGRSGPGGGDASMHSTIAAMTAAVLDDEPPRGAMNMHGRGPGGGPGGGPPGLHAHAAGGMPGADMMHPGMGHGGVPSGWYPPGMMPGPHGLVAHPAYSAAPGGMIWGESWGGPDPAALWGMGAHPMHDTHVPPPTHVSTEMTHAPPPGLSDAAGKPETATSASGSTGFPAAGPSFPPFGGASAPERSAPAAPPGLTGYAARAARPPVDHSATMTGGSLGLAGDPLAATAPTSTARESFASALHSGSGGTSGSHSLTVGSAVGSSSAAGTTTTSSTSTAAPPALSLAAALRSVDQASLRDVGSPTADEDRGGDRRRGWSTTGGGGGYGRGGDRGGGDSYGYRGGGGRGRGRGVGGRGGRRGGFGDRDRGGGGSGGRGGRRGDGRFFDRESPRGGGDYRRGDRDFGGGGSGGRGGGLFGRGGGGGSSGGGGERSLSPEVRRAPPSSGSGDVEASEAVHSPSGRRLLGDLLHAAAEKSREEGTRVRRELLTALLPSIREVARGRVSNFFFQDFYEACTPAERVEILRRLFLRDPVAGMGPMLVGVSIHKLEDVDAPPTPGAPAAPPEGSPVFRDQMIDLMFVRDLATDKHGTRAMQYMVSSAGDRTEQQILQQSVMPLVPDLGVSRGGCHVLMGFLREKDTKWPDDSRTRVALEILEHADHVATNRYGSRVVQHLLEGSAGTLPVVSTIAAHVAKQAVHWVRHDSANFLVSTLFANASRFPAAGEAAADNAVRGRVIELVRDRCGSHVVQAAIGSELSEDTRNALMRELCAPDTAAMVVINRFANYVAQAAIRAAATSSARSTVLRDMTSTLYLAARASPTTSGPGPRCVRDQFERAFPAYAAEIAPATPTTP